MTCYWKKVEININWNKIATALKKQIFLFLSWFSIPFPNDVFQNANIRQVQRASERFVFTGHADDLRRMRMSKIAKSNIRILGFKSSPIMRGGSETSSIVLGSFFFFFFFLYFGGHSKRVWHFLRTFSASRAVICSRKCLKSFIIIMRTTYSRRAWCSQNLRETPNRFRQFGECFAHVSRKQRSSSDDLSTYSRTVSVLLLIRLPFATINLRMSRSIPELFTSYTRTKPAAFTNVCRRFCAHDILTWRLAYTGCPKKAERRIFSTLRAKSVIYLYIIR